MYIHGTSFGAGCANNGAAAVAKAAARNSRRLLGDLFPGFTIGVSFLSARCALESLTFGSGPSRAIGFNRIIGREANAVRSAKKGRIECIDRFQPDLQIQRFPDVEVLEK